MKTWIIFLQKLLVLFMVTNLAVGCQILSTKENLVVSFLEGAELQIETQDQQRELEQALEDMLQLSPKELKKRRYGDYRTTQGMWTLTQILYAYFLQPRPLTIDSDRFYDHVATSAGRSIVEKKLRILQAMELY